MRFILGYFSANGDPIWKGVLMLWGWFLWSGVSIAQDSFSKPMVVEMPSTNQIEGWFLLAGKDCLWLDLPKQRVSIPTAIIEGIHYHDQLLTGEDLKTFLEQETQKSHQNLPKVFPHPVLTSSSVILWSGGPFLFLRDWENARQVTGLETIFWGGVGVGVYQQQWGIIIPFLVAQLALRIWAGRTSFHQAKMNRRQKSLVACEEIFSGSISQ